MGEILTIVTAATSAKPSLQAETNADLNTDRVRSDHSLVGSKGGSGDVGGIVK